MDYREDRLTVYLEAANKVETRQCSLGDFDPGAASGRLPNCSAVARPLRRPVAWRLGILSTIRSFSSAMLGKPKRRFRPRRQSLASGLPAPGRTALFLPRVEQGADLPCRTPCRHQMPRIMSVPAPPGHAHRSDPIAVQRQIDRALGAEIGVRIPCEIAHQAGREPKSPCGGIVVGEQWVDPVVDGCAMIAEPSQAVAHLQRGGDQRILCASRGVEIAEQQPLAKPERRHHHLGRREYIEHCIEDHGRRRQRSETARTKAAARFQFKRWRGGNEPFQRGNPRGRQPMAVDDGKGGSVSPSQARQCPERSADEIQTHCLQRSVERRPPHALADRRCNLLSSRVQTNPKHAKRK